MFKTLRLRFMAMTLSLITLLMLISFLFIYLINFSYVQSSIRKDLMQISNPVNEFYDTYDLHDYYSPGKYYITEKSKKYLDTQLSSRLVSFLIKTDSDNNILSTEATFDADDIFYENAFTLISNDDKPEGKIILDNSYWAYSVNQYNTYYFYTFLNITDHHEFLERLLTNLIIIFVITFFLFFLVSSFLTFRAVEPVREAFNKQKQFISDASHELKTPLAVIQANVDVLLSSQPSMDTPDSVWLSYIKSEVERMGHLTRDLLYLTQMESDEDIQMLRSQFNVSDSIEHLLLGIEVVAFEKNIFLHYDLEPDITYCGNSEQLTQVFMILIDNAIKYTPEQGEIRLELYRSSNHINFHITNSGEGIEPGDIKNIFDRFYRVDKARSRNTGSHGLGLSIAKAIVDQHTGKISCTSILGESTTFTVRFRTNT